MRESLATLLKNPHIWRGGHSAHPSHAGGLPSGYPALDHHLPGGGWPRQALTEILIERHGRGELQLLMPALARLSCGSEGYAGTEEGWIAWIAPPFQPYPPALTQWGVELSRVLVVRPKKSADVLWAAEQALASGNCAAVLSWPQAMSDATSRRLQLAAEKGRSWAIVFRDSKARSEVSAAALRLEVAGGERGTDVVILKSRGGRPVRVQNVFHDLG